jgi:hypothetical protein
MTYLEIGAGAATRGTLERHISRARENSRMRKYVVTPDDLASMEEIARVSSREPVLGKQSRWTELAIYYRPDWARPFVAVTEGKSAIPGEKQRFQYAAMGTLERAVGWFQGSELRDELAASIPDLWTSGALPSRPGKTIFDEQAAGEGLGPIPVYATSLADPLPLKRGEDGTLTLNTDNVWSAGNEASGYEGQPALTDVLAWLYGKDFGSDRALALAFEKDFGVPERTTRNTLAIEAGRAVGKVGPWLQPFLAALRFFDRRRWQAGREKTDG